MSIFNRNKKPEERVEFAGVMDRKVLEDARKKKSGFIRPIVKKIYKKVKEQLNIGRNYEIVPAPETLITIDKAFDVEGLFRRSVDRYVELIWKNGFKFTGQRAKTTSYIQRRFKQIARATGVPTEELFDTIAQHLVKYYNVFILKVRDQKASGGRPYRTFYGKKMNPVAGYFIAEPTRMIARRDKKNKRIKKWENFDDKGKIIGVYDPDDVIHITLNRRRNQLFGTPAATDVLDDIRALRRMEENVEILVFQHAIPLYQYKVGTKEEGPLEGEVDDVKNEIDEMLVHGMLITDGRHDIEAVGARNAALDVTPYLEYFRTRILIGLGQSESSIGIGNASRSSAGMVNKQILDAGGRFQRRIKSYVEDYMISELLEEGGFDSFDPKDEVEFFIPDIDLDDRIRREFHITSLWQSNLVTEDEARNEIGREPMTQSDFEKTFFKRITIPKIEAQVEAQYAALTAAEEGSGEGEATGTPGNSKEAEQKEMPKNQFGTKRRSGEPQRGTDTVEFGTEIVDFVAEYEDVIFRQFGAARSDIVDAVQDGAGDPITANIDVSGDIAIEKTSEIIIDVFREALRRVKSDDISDSYMGALRDLHSENGQIIQSLFNDTTILLREYKDSFDPNVVFDGLNFKVKLAAGLMVQKAYWLAMALAYNDRGIDTLKIVKDGILLYEFSTENAGYESVPPYRYDDVYRSVLQ